MDLKKIEAAVAECLQIIEQYPYGSGQFVTYLKSIRNDPHWLRAERDELHARLLSTLDRDERAHSKSGSYNG